ncbi:hypothetical protein QBC32DRAFT_396670 [Pseudoneurospora amorphoporcata]|uniref:Uncharacterized protein n=1 Tax=Pseudoneurospora amorphoporcata TaxID=241081 RepID=A0AAN6SIA4_9PEZI|nr:hypothetical protein QBC32DRAFT_396670 [Pseudoneurospora amorphoporcata]
MSSEFAILDLWRYRSWEQRKCGLKEEFYAGNSIYAKLHQITGRWGVEERGIERLQSDERDARKPMTVGIPTDSAVEILLRLSFRLNLLVTAVALINVAVCVTSSAINAVVGAQLFHAIQPQMPGWAGILIVSLTTLVIFFARSGNFDPLLPLGKGTAEASGVLSFAASVYTFTAGWAAYAADYSIYQPVDPKPSAAIFWWTFAGNFFPTVFTELLGAAVMTATVHRPDFREAYNEAGLGGVFSHVLIPHVGKGFGTFCIVLLALSIIGTNIATVYSVSMSVQTLGRKTQRVPRFLWTLISTVGYTAFAIPAYAEFATYLENLLLAMSRGVRGYRPEYYTDAKKLPPGIAAITAFCVEAIGVAMGIAQEWYRGPVIKAVGEEFMGDLGCVFGFLFTTVSYMGLTSFEKRYFGR